LSVVAARTVSIRCVCSFASAWISSSMRWRMRGNSASEIAMLSSTATITIIASVTE
jgi:hypothetical protein